MKRHGNGTIFAWFVCGALFGAAAALLAAPESGARLRRRISDQAEQGKKSLLGSSQELFDKGRDLFERGREIAESAAEMFERGRQIAERKIDERI
ncbi:MAG: YtxH domain-containing protein [Acidobacteriaceae bacterium]|nr:YtxH domain-containing protein [Acidobacteriaceae bacterium]